MTVTTAAGTVKRMSGVGSRSGSALPGALMFLAGGALVFWALSGWGLFGLKKSSEALSQFSQETTKKAASTETKPLRGLTTGLTDTKGKGGGGSF